MIPYDQISISPDSSLKIKSFKEEITKFRIEGPLDLVSLSKLEEHFKASHIYHSAGIEGNRLTLQETLLVLKEGIDITGKSLNDSIEVKNLGKAFDFLKELAQPKLVIRETDIRDLHKLILGNEPNSHPGEYRKSGVIISGADHKPPEPLEVPSRMKNLVEWINLNIENDPFITASIAHHELTNIHPFLDGNGRTSRLLLNLILLKNGFPICNIKREERPHYYECLSFADNGIFDFLIELVVKNCNELFSEYMRIRDESKRIEEWAKRWGTKESEILLRRESREFELWQSRIRQILLEFKKASEQLNDKLENFSISFYEFSPIDFEKYQKLIEHGSVEQSNFFSIEFYNKLLKKHERFMFRFFRNWTLYPRGSGVIPLELNYYDRVHAKYSEISEVSWSNCIRLRSMYFTIDGDFRIRCFRESTIDCVEKKERMSDAVQMFFDDILKNVFDLK